MESTSLTSIPLYLSQRHACNYLEEQTASDCFVHPNTPINQEIYSQLLAHGFRRSGNYVYRPQCPECVACTPIRIDSQQFTPNRSQKRTWNKNKDTRTIIKPARYEQKHYELYLRYQNNRHPDSSMANSSPDEYMSFLTSRWCDSHFVEFIHGSELTAVAVVDHVDQALSAVYTFFDPQYNHLSPGRHAILWQINYAKQLGIPWLYLGYWIAECQKMSYKNQYRPAQGLIKDQWQFLD